MLIIICNKSQPARIINTAFDCLAARKNKTTVMNVANVNTEYIYGDSAFITVVIPFDALFTNMLLKQQGCTNICQEEAFFRTSFSHEYHSLVHH